MKVGPVSARFKGKVTLSDLDPPNGYKISGEGEGGVAGFAKGGATVALADKDGGTLLSYNVEAQIGGKLAQLGQRLIMQARARNWPTSSSPISQSCRGQGGRGLKSCLARGPGKVAPRRKGPYYGFWNDFIAASSICGTQIKRVRVVAVITGGGRGIGRALSVGLARAGAAVVVAGRSAETCEATVAEIEAFGGVAAGVPADVGTPRSASASSTRRSPASGASTCSSTTPASSSPISP